jgi:hypothetical protein
LLTISLSTSIKILDNVLSTDHLGLVLLVADGQIQPGRSFVVWDIGFRQPTIVEFTQT